MPEIRNVIAGIYGLSSSFVFARDVSEAQTAPVKGNCPSSDIFLGRSCLLQRRNLSWIVFVTLSALYYNAPKKTTVLYCYIAKSNPTPPLPQPDSTWRPSRYIIDNRRNALFSKKPLAALLQQSQEEPPRESASFNPDSFKPKMFPIERYHKDLSAEASIVGPKFYRKYPDNALPRKVIKSLNFNGGLGSEFKYDGVFENQKNASGVLDPQNFLQNDGEVLNEVTSKTVTTTKEEAQSWEAKINNDAFTSATSSTAATSSDGRSEASSRPNGGLDFGSSTTTSFPWNLANTKAEEENQIDNANEKHVYETRIETVSYHQEVIFNPPKKPDWFREEPKQEQRSYEPPEENYEEQEKNYETPEKNYEEQEKNYESPEKNYEEREKNYEVDVMPSEEIHSPGNGENTNKFGYVVEGTNYRKYRVEERTVDGFIVGEYGVVSHDDGSLRGVRYTADGNTNPQLIYETLIKFLSL